MSDLRPNGIPLELGGQRHMLLFTLGVIDEIQEKCNAPFHDVIDDIARAASFDTSREVMASLGTVLTILLNRNRKQKFTEDEIRNVVEVRNYTKTAWKILEAYGASIPDPDEDDEEPEDESPNRKTGR